MTTLGKPKYHRQRFLLVLLELAGGLLSKIDLQKLLFLWQQETHSLNYDFVPYHYGCYSFQAHSDAVLLESRGWLKTEGKDIRLVKNPSGMTIDEGDLVEGFVKKYKDYRGTKLIRHVYGQYPYYAINSRVAEEILDASSYEKVLQAKNNLWVETEELFTIGYEGLSFEKYANQLIRRNVRLLCDVRRNPLSMKFGFSKGNLSAQLPKLGIKYLHIPELGIQSEYRKNLETESDYKELFETYKKSLLQKKESLETLGRVLDRHKRVALTCFEKRPESCHRNCISEYMEGARDIKAVHL
ncbi:MAG: DUF488 domain-containing protein [Nitrospinae bacterium]|nr:DUF488 domain-containing protein [Nitrospinota bacterium]